MARIVKLKTPQGEVSAIEQQWEIGKEEWNEYKLLDGGVVRLRTTVQKIYRVLDADGKPAYTSEGDPSFMVRHNTQVVGSE